MWGGGDCGGIGRRLRRELSGTGGGEIGGVERRMDWVGLGEGVWGRGCVWGLEPYGWGEELAF